MAKDMLYNDRENVQLRYSKTLLYKLGIVLYKVFYKEKHVNRYVSIAVHDASYEPVETFVNNIWGKLKEINAAFDLVIFSVME